MKAPRQRTRSTRLALFLLALGGLGTSVAFAIGGPGQPGARSGGCAGLVHVPFPLSLKLLFATDDTLSAAQSVLLRMRAMASEASMGILTTLELSILDAEFQSLLEQFDRTTYWAKFHGIRLVNGGEDVCLEGPPPPLVSIVHDTPDATTNAFDFRDMGVYSAGAALTAFEKISRAIRSIHVLRFEVRQELQRLLS